MLSLSRLQMIYENLSKQEVYRSESDTEIEDSVADSTDGVWNSFMRERERERERERDRCTLHFILACKMQLR